MIDQRHEIWIRKKFPIFYTIKINLEQEFTQNQLETLQVQLQTDRNNLSKHSQKTFKKLRKLANDTQKQFKSNKELYTILSIAQPQELHEIILPNKMVASLEPLRKRNLLKLNDIDLAYNKVESLGPVFTCNLPSLRYFNMEKNAVTNLKGLEECTWTNLKILNLSNNNITNIQPFSINEFPSLSKVDLSQNKITNISGIHKSTSKEIVFLNLEKNRLMEVRNIERLWVKKITELNIKDNELVGSERIEKFQPTTVRTKRVVMDGGRGELLGFINYEYKIMYSKALYQVSNKHQFWHFLGLQSPQHTQKNILSSSKHSKYSAIDQYKKKQENQSIIPTKKLLIFD